MVIIGILTRAKESKDKTIKAEEQERINIEVLASLDEYGVLDLGILKNNINKHISNAKHDDSSDFPLTVTYEETQNSYMICGNGKTLTSDIDAVAMVDNEFYNTLQNAINIVPTDNTEKEVILLKDTTENLRTVNNTNIVLNLNHKTVNGGTNTTINPKGTLIIKNGTLKSENGKVLENAGTTTISGADTKLISYSESVPTINNSKTLIIKGRKN